MVRTESGKEKYILYYISNLKACKTAYYTAVTPTNMHWTTACARTAANDGDDCTNVSK